MVGGPGASVLERSRRRPCLWWPWRRREQACHPPHPSAPLAAPFAPASRTLNWTLSLGRRRERLVPEWGKPRRAGPEESEAVSESRGRDPSPTVPAPPEHPFSARPRRARLDPRAALAPLPLSPRRRGRAARVPGRAGPGCLARPCTCAPPGRVALGSPGMGVAEVPSLPAPRVPFHYDAFSGIPVNARDPNAIPSLPRQGGAPGLKGCGGSPNATRFARALCRFET